MDGGRNAGDISHRVVVICVACALLRETYSSMGTFAHVRTRARYLRVHSRRSSTSASGLRGVAANAASAGREYPILISSWGVPR